MFGGQILWPFQRILGPGAINGGADQVMSR